MTVLARDWLAFLGIMAGLSAAHLAAAAAAGLLAGVDLLEGLLFYAGKGWFGPLVALALVGLAQLASRVFNSAWLERPGRSAWKLAVGVGILGVLSASEVRALFA